LPGLPLGVRLSGSIWLQDSVYDQVDGALALLHDLDMHSRLEVTFSRQWSFDKLADQESQSFAGGLALVLDHRNQVPFPTRGFHLEMSSQGIRRQLADSSRYLIRSQMAGHGYFPLFSRFLFHGKWDVGGNWPRHPLALRGDRYDLGGARTLRGYREREFSTDLYGYTQLELQWLLAGQGRVLTFVSPGLVNKQTPSVWWTSVMGYGVGLELGSRAWSVGLLYALNPKRSWGQGLVHLTLDNRF
jgi:outer membrane protein assembly factor BamA